MPRITEIELLGLPEQPVLRIAKNVAASELPSTIYSGYTAMKAHLEAHNGFLSDVPFVLYKNMNPMALDIELCFPLPSPMCGGDGIEEAVIPAQKAIFCLFLGDYGQAEAIYKEMGEWLSQHNQTSQGTCREYYYNGPEFQQEYLLTKIVIPIAE